MFGSKSRGARADGKYGKFMRKSAKKLRRFNRLKNRAMVKTGHFRSFN